MHRLFKADPHDFRIINQGWTRLRFPWFHEYSILRGLDVLTKLGHVTDERLGDAVEGILQKRRDDGTWVLERSPMRKMQANIEAVGKPSKWVTLIALRALKRLSGR